ncbi:MAG: DUF3955 domain-containing protein [Vulcanococcus sp.]
MTPPRFDQRYCHRLAWVLFGGAVACQVSFHLIGSRVDAQGILREPFWLLPLSTALGLGGGASLLAAWLSRAEHH